MKTTVFLALMMACAYAIASFPDQSPAQQFYDESRMVLYGQIASGELIQRDGHTCGAKYTINVLRQFKAESSGSLEVMDGPGVSDPKIGGKYLFFLSERNGRQLSNLIEYQGLPEDWLKACSTTNREVFQTLRLEESFNGGTTSFIVPERIIAFPVDIPRNPMARQTDRDALLELTWISSEAVFSFLGSLESG